VGTPLACFGVLPEDRRGASTRHRPTGCARSGAAMGESSAGGGGGWFAVRHRRRVIAGRALSFEIGGDVAGWMGGSGTWSRNAIRVRGLSFLSRPFPGGLPVASAQMLCTGIRVRLRLADAASRGSGGGGGGGGCKGTRPVSCEVRWVWVVAGPVRGSGCVVVGRSAASSGHTVASCGTKLATRTERWRPGLNSVPRSPTV